MAERSYGSYEIFYLTYDIKPHLDFSSDCTKPSGKLTQGKPFTIKELSRQIPNLTVCGAVSITETAQKQLSSAT